MRVRPLARAACLALCGAGLSPAGATPPPSDAEAACMAAARALTRADDIAVVGSKPDAAGTLVTIDVGPAAFSCRASAAGVVERITRTGDDGAASAGQRP